MLVHAYVYRTFSFGENYLSVQKSVFYSLRVEHCIYPILSQMSCIQYQIAQLMLISMEHFTLV